MKTNNLNQIKNKIIFNIRNMSMEEFCARVNDYARATRYCNETNNVCELLDTLKSGIKVVHLVPEYFGTDTAYLVVDDELDNDFKELFIDGMIRGWEVCQDDYVSIFGDH